MVDIIINAVGGRLLLYISAGLLAGCIGLGITVKIQSSALTASVAEAKRLVAEKKNLGDKIAEQNRAVADLQAKGEEQAQRIKAAEHLAARVRTITVERVREAAAAPVPADCPAAVRWAADRAVEFNRRWEAE